tara:strand:+ start:204 stop:473 length:270 start_codon:yes stop_codon:yes gene_type:complete
MEVLKIYDCRVSIDPKDPLENIVEVSAVIDFNYGDGPETVCTELSYCPSEWSERELVTSHSGEPQQALIDWLKTLRENREDWQPLTEII